MLYQITISLKENEMVGYVGFAELDDAGEIIETSQRASKFVAPTPTRLKELICAKITDIVTEL